LKLQGFPVSSDEIFYKIRKNISGYTGKKNLTKLIFYVILLVVLKNSKQSLTKILFLQKIKLFFKSGGLKS